MNEYKFNHNFDYCVNPFCTCSLQPESTSHFFLHCHHYNTIQSILFNNLKNSVDKNLSKLSDNRLTLILLYGSTQYYSIMKNCILLNLKKTLNFMAPFYGWGLTASRLESWGSLLFTTKFPEITGTHFIDLGRMKGWVDLGATQWYWTRDPWIGNLFNKVHWKL